MTLLAHTARTWLRALAVAGCVGTLAGGTAAPTALANPAQARPITCEATSHDVVSDPTSETPAETSYRGSGTVTCRDTDGRAWLEGTGTFSGTIPTAEAASAGATPVYRSRVDWSDGTVTTGTFTDFHEETVGNLQTVTIKGTTDAASTRFANWGVSVVGTSVREEGSFTDGVHDAQSTTVTYTP
ncbi:hypothetical protein ACFVU0_16310 [Streptomyces sp. NPDC058122]|uniref:hypothetical protein n=1 Tax=Streptomyces sp. NPDC058122 TaxID=3346349 RepID=UPI0036EFAD9C